MELILQAVLIALNAVFACAEIAVISMNSAKLTKLAGQGDKRALKLEALTSQPARFLATIQVAITLSGFLGSAFAADHFSDKLVDWLLGLGVGMARGTLDSIAVVMITLVLSYFTLVFGELVPKRLAMRNAEKLALGMASMLRFVSRVFAPLVWLLTASTNGILRLLGIDPNGQDEQVTEEEIRMMVDAGGENGSIGPEEQAFIQNVFEFDDLTAGEICTHRTKMAVLWEEAPPEEWEALIQNTNYANYPICGKDRDDIKGILETSTYFRLPHKTKKEIAAAAVRPAWFVPETIKADVLFSEMRQSGKSFTVVMDEHGGVQGVITLYDLVRRLVGDLDEKRVQRKNEVLKLDTGVLQVTGEATLEEISRALEMELDGGPNSTFSGYIFEKLGRIPPQGETFFVTAERLEIEAVCGAGHTVARAVITKKQTEKEPEKV
ncbi:MAG: hemolysin family protein [Oscillospiraceae bacterium]|nr:hemolysin family protein [Oscillospiraceae bacterium]